MAWFNTTRFDPDVVSWQFDVFEWLFVNFGGFERFKRQALVTPTADFFPFNPTDDHSYATVVFETVKDYMGMDDWFCSLKKAMKEMRRYSHRLQHVREVVPIPDRE